MAPTTADRGREVRRRLLDTAAALIAERGWTAVSTRVLAERAGVAAGVVHYHFGSVPALLREAALAAVRGVLDRFGPALAAAGTADDLVALLVSGLEPYDGTDPTSLLFAETYLAATRDEALRADLGEVVTGFRRLLADRLAALRVAAPEATAALLAATVDGVMLHRPLVPGPTPDEAATVLSRLVTGDARRRTGKGRS